MEKNKNIPDSPSEILKLLLEIAEKSNCSDYKMGVIIKNESNEIVSTGYNYIPDYNDEESPFPEGSDKNNQEGISGLPRAVHAEVLAVINYLLSKNNLSRQLEMYTLYAPCAGCAEIISLLGIKKVYYIKEFYNDFGKLVLKKKRIPFEKLQV